MGTRSCSGSLLGPADLAFVGGTRSERNRLALALLRVWARVERKLASDPAALPARSWLSSAASSVSVRTLWPATVAGPPLAPTSARSAGSWESERSGQRTTSGLSAFVAEKVAHTGNTGALVDATEAWLVREGVLRPSGETTIERLVYAARAQAEGRLFADIAGQLGQRQREALDAL